MSNTVKDGRFGILSPTYDWGCPVLFMRSWKS